MKKIFQIIIWLVVGAGIVFLLSFAMTDHKSVTCGSVTVEITDQSGESFIGAEDIHELITANFDSVHGCLLDSINTSAMASLLNKNPYIRKAEVFKSVSGNIQIEVEREIPLVRIFNKNHENFYLAVSGAVMPANNRYTPHLLVASGMIDESWKTVKDSVFYAATDEKAAENLLSSVHYLTRSIRSNPFLDGYVEQIYIGRDDNIELVPADGDHIILLGDVRGLSKKLSNLMTFYRAGKPSVSEGYRTVNLKYMNQVVCKK